MPNGRRMLSASPAVVVVLAWSLPALAQTVTRGPYLQAIGKRLENG